MKSQAVARSLRRAPVEALIAAAGGALLLVLLSTLSGADPAATAAALWRGSLGTAPGLAESLIRTIPLAFTGLAVAVAFRAGVWNIGAEGQFLLGMTAASWSGIVSGKNLPYPAPLLLSLAAGVTAGAAWAGIAALLRSRRRTPEVISTILLNFIAAYLVSYLVRGPMRDPGSISDWSERTPPAARLPALAAAGPDFGELGRIHSGAILAAGSAILLWILLTRTRTGFQMNVLGAGPRAAATAGIPVERTAAAALLTGGALAGLGGAVEISGVLHRLYHYTPGTPGYGYAGIAVALLGGLHPAAVVGAAFFFGALDAGCSQMQRSAGVPAHTAYIFQALIVLAIICRRAGGPNLSGAR